MTDWEHHESEQEWERRQFEEWEDREFSNNRELAAEFVEQQANSEQLIEFAIRELATSLRNLITVVDENIDTYNLMVPSTLHVALLNVIDEIANWKHDV